MKDNHEKSKLIENENTVFPNVFKLESTKPHPTNEHMIDSKSLHSPKPDTTAHHQSSTHKPRQLPGRHH